MNIFFKSGSQELNSRIQGEELGGEVEVVFLVSMDLEFGRIVKEGIKDEIKGGSGFKNGSLSI